ncbi:BglG family transcription antiterminator [Caproiciproducens galactitolivorans]|uniref:BglG family transcription antiterminator n=1 Tax=Caproiciproducens galactitolivorans TaxID=642589 RepID=UPI0024091CC9|nr:BglG family transcription antiterminator [Caproiciproducens galactitolivorans]
MNKRVSDIMNDIISKGGDGGIPFFAQKYHVSERTIRNDLKTINGILCDNRLPPFNISSNGAIVYYGEKKPILNLIKRNDFYAYKLSKEERKIAFSLILLLSDNFVTLTSVAEELFVSRTTLINDLDSVKQLLRSRNLEVESRPNKGIRLLGSERARRHCIIDIALAKLGLSSKQYGPFYNMILSLIDRNESDKQTIEQIIKTEERKNGLRFTDTAFATLVYCLIVSIGRMSTGNFAEEREDLKDANYPLAKNLLAYTTDYFHLPLRKSEIQFLSEILRELSPARRGGAHESSVEIQVIATKFIRNISENLGIDLTSDFTFYKNLENHLQATLRNRFASLPQSSVTELIAQNYSDVMRVTKKEAVILEDYIRHTISENEISYLAMHICAAIERKRGSRKRARIAVACGGGVGTSELLVERLQKRFSFDIAAVVAAHNADTLKDAGIDFIISTVPVKNCGIDYIQVSPFLDDGDYLKICRYLDSKHPARTTDLPEKRLTSEGLMKKLQPILSELIPQEDATEAIILRVRKAAAEYFGERTEHGTAMLCQLLSPDKIRLDVECCCSDEAIRQSADILLKQGYILPQYIEAIFQNMRENGSYFVLSPGFAVPHAGLGNGSQKMGMSLLRLKHPVPFGNEEFDPVEFVCCLSAVDSDSHLKAFFNLVNLLRMDEFKAKLHVAATPDVAAEIIRIYESRIAQ